MARRLAPILALLLPAAGLLGGEPGGPGTVGRPPATGRTAEPLEAAELFVNGKPITRSYLDLRIAAYRRADPRAPEQILRQSARWSIVFAELLRAEAQPTLQLGMAVPEQMVEEYWRQMLRKAGGPAELARQEGLSVAALKDQARDECLAEVYRYTLRQQQVRPTPAELRDYYLANRNLFHRPEAVEARAVVIRRFLYDDPEGRAPRQDAKERAQKVLDQLDAGADFAGLVARYSEEPASAAHQGRLGEPTKGFRVERGAYEAAVEKALFTAEPGAPAVLVEGRANFYVLQVLKRLPAGLAPFADVEGEVLSRCTRDRLRKAEEKFFREAFNKVLVLDSAGRRLTADHFLAPPAAPRKRSLFDREEEPAPAPERSDRSGPTDPSDHTGPEKTRP